MFGTLSFDFGQRVQSLKCHSAFLASLMEIGQVVLDVLLQELVETVNHEVCYFQS